MIIFVLFFFIHFIIFPLLIIGNGWQRSAKFINEYKCSMIKYVKIKHTKISCRSSYDTHFLIFFKIFGYFLILDHMFLN